MSSDTYSMGLNTAANCDVPDQTPPHTNLGLQCWCSHLMQLKCYTNVLGIDIIYTNSKIQLNLELGYLEFCVTRSVNLNQKYILIVFSNHYLTFGTFLQVQITRSAN